MTSQMEERLILDGVAIGMAFCPPLPPDPRLLIPTTTETIEEINSPNRTTIRTFEVWTGTDGTPHREETSSFIYSTACWRAYLATWELKNGLFYLRNVTGRFRPAFNQPILADWFTGVLRVKSGEELCYVHMGFGTVTEYETHIAIEAGREIGRRSIDNRGRTYDWKVLGWRNLPGHENNFPGDTEI